ncbi:hypothetical protein HWV62_28344 [Athelia sp. TMB]|nr:hypothetical protein HWV62_28344 [Athelia sp. TMB]
MFKASQKSHLYTELAELPLPTSASFDSSDVINVSFSRKIHDRDAKRTISKTFFVTPSQIVTSDFRQEASDVQASAVSPSGARKAILRQTTDEKPKRFVEIWAGDLLEVSKEVTSTHGAFCVEGELLHFDYRRGLGIGSDDYDLEALHSLSFSPSEDTLLYSAEANDSATNEAAGKDIDQYERFRYTPTLGEGFSGKKRPTLYVLRWPSSGSTRVAKESITLTPLTISSKQNTVLIAQAVLADQNRVFATGYEYMQSGRLLGIKGCYNRPAAVWELHLPGAATDETQELTVISRLSPENRSARSPHLSPDGLSLIWLSHPLGGAHSACTTLHRMDIRSGEQNTVVDTVMQPQESNGFPGLYEPNLPSKTFISLGKGTYIATSSYWRSRTTVLLISVDGGEVKDLTPLDSGMFSWTILSTDSKNRIVCARSSPAVPHEVLLGHIGDDLSVSWQVLFTPRLSPEIQKQLATLEASIIPVPDHSPAEVLLVRTKSSPASTPCICMPHGGPHATHVTTFSAASAAFALAGYNCSLVNYTGSLGFGEKYIKKLIGQCGTLDVQECISSVDHLIDQGISERGHGKQFVFGGSHGGFLSAHLIGQYPDTFTAACIRNPVISGGEISTTDIPDWYFFEFGLPYDSKTIMTPEIYSTLFAASPISHVDKVKAKVLLHLGLVDQRVAPTNAIGYYNALKGRGKAVEMLAFPKDSHPLDGVETSRICWESARDWFDLAKE